MRLCAKARWLGLVAGSIKSASRPETKPAIAGITRSPKRMERPAFRSADIHTATPVTAPTVACVLAFGTLNPFLVILSFA